MFGSSAGGIIGNGQQGRVKNCISLWLVGEGKHPHCGSVAGQIFRCPLINCYAYYGDDCKKKSGIGYIMYAADMKVTDTVVAMNIEEIKERSNVKNTARHSPLMKKQIIRSLNVYVN